MNVALRGLTVLVGATTLAMALSAQALATPASPASTSVKTVNSCTQDLPAGRYACFAERRSDLGFTSKATLKAKLQANALAAPSGYGPSSLQSAYKLPSATAGSGQRVYIVDAYDDPNAESDLASYRTQYGLPACTTANGCFKKLNQNGAASPLPAGDTGWAGEISLDLDMVSAICPNCGITLIEANDASNNLFTAVKTAANLGAKFVSLSWGGQEDGSEASYDSTYFKSSGVVYTASTGDDAYQYGVIYPATSADTVAVGGTSLLTATSTRGWTETVWKNSTSQGTGSGCSSDEVKPSWQSIIPTSVCSRRAVSDVSAVADPSTGVAVYQSYGGSGWAVYGGTSASAPIIASVYALAGTPAATDKPASFPYAHTGNLYDVTSGNNGTCSPTLLCTAAAGWDGPTGLGTPNGVAAFNGTSSSGTGATTKNTVTITKPGNRTGTVGIATSLQISAADSGGAALTYTATGLPTGLSINASGRISGKPTTPRTFTTTVTATDSTKSSAAATFTWTISSNCTGQKLVNPGFESGATGWSHTSGIIRTASTARTGKRLARLDGTATTRTDTLSQAVKIPTGCSATLTYYLQISSADHTTRVHDRLALTINGTKKTSLSNLNRGTRYIKHTLNLSSYAGKTVTIKWTGTENNSLQTSFRLDDTAVTLTKAT